MLTHVQLGLGLRLVMVFMWCGATTEESPINNHNPNPSLFHSATIFHISLVANFPHSAFRILPETEPHGQAEAEITFLLLSQS